MEIQYIVLQIAIQVILLVGVGLILRKFLPSYFEEKGKNLATKEDIADITDKIEAVRAQYERQSLRHRLAFEKEFEILSELWAALVKLRDATAGLRPTLDGYDPDEPADQRRTKRLSVYSQSHGEFAELLEKNRPFYPMDIYEVLSEIRDIAFEEAFDYSESHTVPSRPVDRVEYYRTARENVSKILAGVDSVCDLIRERIVQ